MDGENHTARRLIHPDKRRRKTYTPNTNPILHSVLVICSILLLSLHTTQAAPTCLRFADALTINQLFTDGGPGTKVLLCPSKVYHLQGTIVFTAADQELATFGYPTGPERATIRIENDRIATAIQGDCRRCARVKIQSLVIDGNREGLGRMIEHDPSGLIVIGGNEGQTVKRCSIKGPRGFTAVHVREGDKLSCKGAIVEQNEIGPVGDEYDPEVDGDDPEMSPIGRPLADGVSIACRDSFVRDNTFVDNTAAAIVIYCSPGTLVHANQIYARKASMMGGILMVDSVPFDGDYSKVVVKSNIIHAESRTIRVGIGIGAAVWSDDIDMVLKGGTVSANGFKGNFMGYSIAAAGLEEWTIKDNWDESIHQGKRSARCFDEPINPDPMAFLYYGDTVKTSDLQPDFVNGEFQYVVCIDGLEDSSNIPKAAATIVEAKETATSSISTETQAASNNVDLPGLFSTGSEVMDDILEHSQLRMLEAFADLSERIDRLAYSRRPVPRSGGASGTLDVETAISHLRDRLDAIEERQEVLVGLVDQFQKKITVWDEEFTAYDPWQADAIASIQERFHILTEKHEKSSSSEQGTKAGVKRTPSTDLSKTVGGVTRSILEVVAVSIAVAILCEVGKRFWPTRHTHRKSM